MRQSTGYDDLQTDIRQLKTPPIETWEISIATEITQSRLRT